MKRKSIKFSLLTMLVLGSINSLSANTIKQVYDQDGNLIIPTYPVNDKRALSESRGGDVPDDQAGIDGVGTVIIGGTLGANVEYNKLLQEAARKKYSIEDLASSGKLDFVTIETLNAICSDSQYVCPQGMRIREKGSVICKSTPQCSDKDAVLVGNNCEKNWKDAIPALESISYSCNEGDLSGSNCIVPTIELIGDRYKNIDYSCPTGVFGSDGKTCVLPDTIYTPANETIKYKCTTGVLSGTTECLEDYIKRYSPDQENIYYTCPEGTLSGQSCVIPTTKLVPTDVRKISYECPEGTLSGTTCLVPSTKIVPKDKQVIKYTCSAGVVSGSKCKITNTYTKASSKRSYYSCPSPSYRYATSLSGSKCYKPNDPYKKPYPARLNTKYTCPSGYSLSGTICKRTTVSYVNATKNISYTCSTGVVTSTGCRVPTTVTKPAVEKVSWTCSTGTLVNGQCKIPTTKTIAATKHVTYGCKPGVKQVEGMCEEPAKRTVPAIPYSIYNCSKGTLIGKQCKIETTKSIPANEKVTYYCTEGIELNGKCYKEGTKTVPAIKHITYSCSDGVLNGSKCIVPHSDVEQAICENGNLIDGTCELRATLKCLN